RRPLDRPQICAGAPRSLVAVGGLVARRRGPDRRARSPDRTAALLPAQDQRVHDRARRAVRRVYALLLPRAGGWASLRWPLGEFGDLRDRVRPLRDQSRRASGLDR